MPICSHINFYSLTLKVHFDLLWPLWPLFGLFDNFFQLLNIHFNLSNRGASSEVTIILVISINKFRFLGPKNGRLLNRERIVQHRWFSGRMLACHAGGPGSIPGRCKSLLSNEPYLLLAKVLEAPGIDPGTSRMLSERSTI